MQKPHLMAQIMLVLLVEFRRSILLPASNTYIRCFMYWIYLGLYLSYIYDKYSELPDILNTSLWEFLNLNSNFELTFWFYK